MSAKAKPKSEAPRLDLNHADAAELRSERAKAEQALADVEVSLAKVAAEVGAEFRSPDVNEARLGELTKKRASLERSREKALARVAEVERMVETASTRRAARESMQRRVVEYQRLVDETAAGHKILRDLLAAAKRAEEQMPWKKVEDHPMAIKRGRLLREEIAWDAREAGLEPPELPPAPPEFVEARELRAISNSLSYNANPETIVGSGPLSARGKAAQRKKQEENSYAGGNGQTASFMRE